MWTILCRECVQACGQVVATAPCDDHYGAANLLRHAAEVTGRGTLLAPDARFRFAPEGSAVPELVAIAEQLLAPVPGGTGRYTRELLRAMALTAPGGWEVSSVVSRSGDPEGAVVAGVQGPHVLRVPRKAMIAAWEHGVPLWPGGDSVHAMTPLAPPRARSRRVVVTVHDAVPWTHPETLTRRGVVWHRRMIGRAARGADAVVVPTAAVAAELARYVDVTARVVGEGVSDSLLAQPITIPEWLPAHYVLAIGTVEPRKGLEYLVRAMAAQRAPEIPLLIAGQIGWGGVDLRTVADDCGLPRSRLRLLGATADSTLAAVLQRASVLVAPSLAEGFGLPVLEAMAAGVPVVHSDAPALVEIAGGAGIVVPRAEPAALAAAIREVVDNPVRRAELVAAGRRRAQRFTWERAARDVWQLHLELRESGRRGTGFERLR
jgi:glycosyltransferase involved in cell wall biosynthesis